MKPLKPVFLKCAVQKYEWGKRGEESAAARIFSRNSGCPIEDKPYAELWMGTHDSGPSLVLFSGSSLDSEFLPLKEWLSQNPEVLGDRVVRRWGADLPFFFKSPLAAAALFVRNGASSSSRPVKRQPAASSCNNHACHGRESCLIADPILPPINLCTSPHRDDLGRNLSNRTVPASSPPFGVTLDQS